MELCLGTVQFGMDYGVIEQPKKDADYCVRCLDYAIQNGIQAIDTATAYGTAEEIVGTFLKKKTIGRDKLFVSTKLLPNILDDCVPEQYESIIVQNVEKSLKTLGTDYIDAYFLHSSRYAFDQDILEVLSVVKNRGLAMHIGVSVYYPEEAQICLDSPIVNYIQLPYSIFDHRMKEAGIFAKESSCQIDSRTAFIKGLIRYDVEAVPEHLSKAKPILQSLDKICKETGYSRIELALGYIKRENRINHLVFGIRDMEQLKEDIKSFEREIPTELFDDLEKTFSGIDADLVIPSLWKK